MKRLMITIFLLAMPLWGELIWYSFPFGQSMASSGTAQADTALEGRAALRLAGGYASIRQDGNQMSRIPLTVTADYRKGRIRLVGILPTQILTDGDGWSKYGMDDMFLLFSVNPPGLPWSNFHLGTRFSRPVEMLFQTAKNVFTTGGSGDNMDFILGFSAPVDIGIMEMEPCIKWVYSTRLNPWGEDTWYDAVSPGSLLLLPIAMSAELSENITLSGDIVPFHRGDSELIDLLPDGSEYEESISDGFAGIYTGIELSAPKFFQRPSLRIESSITEKGHVNSFSLLFSLDIGRF